MDMLKATDVRKNWSLTLDSVVRERPAYIKRTHDSIAMMDVSTLNDLLIGYQFVAKKYQEDDGSITLSLVDIDIVANAPDETSAKKRLAAYIKEYAEEFYDEYEYWSKAPNRKAHIPYVFKALTLDIDDIAGGIKCQGGKN